MKAGIVDDVEVNEDAAAGIAAQLKINNERDYFQEFSDVRFLIDMLTLLTDNNTSGWALCLQTSAGSHRFRDNNKTIGLLL